MRTANSRLNSWNTSNTSTSSSLSIGDSHQGGIVFYLDGNGGGLTEEKLMKILATMNNNEQVIRVQTPIHIVGGELLKSEKTSKDS